MSDNWATYTVVDKILVAEYKLNSVIDLEGAKSMVAQRLKYQNGMTYPIINVLNGLKMSSKKTRTYLAQEGTECILAGAFIVSNSMEQISTDFFLSIEKPPIPVKSFTELQEAITWINEIRKINSHDKI